MNEDQKLHFFENTIRNLDISTPPPSTGAAYWHLNSVLK